MKFYSNLKVNVLSLIITILIYIFLVNYIPQVFKVGREYFYYKFQPNIIKEYEE